MNGSDHSTSSAQRAAGPIRKGVLFVSILSIAVLISALFAVKSLVRHGRAPQPPPQKPAQVATVPELNSDSLSHKVTATQKNLASASSKGLPVAPVATPPAARSVRQVMGELVELSESRGPITREQAEQFKQNLEELVRQGAPSVQAIREFLQKNVDTDFGNISGADQLGYSSFRAALFDTLKQIGGLESQAAMVEAL